MKRKILFIGLVLFVFVLISCKQNDSSSSSDVSISGFSYSANNYPDDYWSSSETYRPSLCYNFELAFSGAISVNDISSVNVYINDTDSSWTINPSNLNTENHVLVSNFHWYSSNLNELPIGELTAKVALTDGSILSKKIIMGIPGSTTNGQYQYVYNRDNETTATYPAVSYKALQRPVITSFYNSNNEMSVSFKIVGDNVNNGYVWFYDNAGSYIGCSRTFRDSSTGACYSGLNNGVAFNSLNNGVNSFVSSCSGITKNNVQISVTDFNSIAKARVVVIDGAQYETSAIYSDYDYRAVSAFSN